jgi:hypothetical protein
MDDPEVISQLQKSGLHVFKKRTLAEAKTFWDQQFSNWGKVLKQLGII